jgi:Cu/Ag efflux protein CusF
MLKRQSKILSIALIFTFCMSFMFVGFAPQTAEAATMYQVIKAPTVTPASPAVNQNIDAVVKVTLPDTTIANGSILTVSMPSEWTFAPAVSVPVVAASTGNAVEIVAPGAGAAGNDVAFAPGAFAAGPFAINPNNTFDLQMAGPIPGTEQGSNRYFYIYFNGVNLNNSSGDLKVTFLAPSGSAFETALDVVIGKSTRSGATTSTIKKVKEISGNDTLDIISVLENSAGTFDVATPGAIKLKILTKGFTWNNAVPAAVGGASYGWAFAGAEALNTTAGGNTVLSADEKTLTYTINAAFTAGATTPGRISFANLPIEVDDTVVKAGTELEVELSGAGMTKQTLTVAKFVDFGLSVTEGTSKEVLAGQNGVKVGNFFINESAAGSWVAGRTITFGLPSGAQWDTVGDIDVVNSSDIGAITSAITGDNNEFLKLTLSLGPPAATSTTNGAKIELSDFKVDLAPDFDGPVEVTITGNAGVTGKIKIADAKPIATIEVAELKDIEIGKPNQLIGDITLIESMSEGFLNSATPGNQIRLVFDNGYRFSKVPKVEVTEGDLDINKSGVNINENVLTIPVKSQSAKTAAKILISDIYVDAYRTAPEGKVTIKFDNGNSALNELAGQFPNEYPGKAVVANCVTPAPGQKIGNGEFRIDSNIYYVGGVAKVMDVAPYIKGDRTYVPMRYLGEILGAEVVWDDAARTVTLTKGDDVVVFTIGSATYTVNGESTVADVAPEIASDRTMLPARYVAEAFGAVVGWDAGTRTVLIQN